MIKKVTSFLETFILSRRSLLFLRGRLFISRQNVSEIFWQYYVQILFLLFLLSASGWSVERVLLVGAPHSQNPYKSNET